MDAQAQLDSFIDKFTPEVAALTRALLAKAKARIPGATILVYDNYNALAIGFGPSDKAGQAILSLAVMPRWVTLCLPLGRPPLRSAQAAQGRRQPGAQRPATYA